MGIMLKCHPSHIVCYGSHYVYRRTTHIGTNLKERQIGRLVFQAFQVATKGR